MATPDAKAFLFEKIVTENRRRILAIVRSFSPSSEREDLCQEILLQMWRGLGRFQGRSTLSTWVYRVALNTAITYRRKNGRRLEPKCTSLETLRSELPAPPDPGSQLLVLEEFLHSLGKIDRALFLLYLEDLTYTDIAEVTGLTTNHIGVRINRLKGAFSERYCGGESWKSKVISQSG